jgi:hypothetical protein
MSEKANHPSLNTILKTEHQAIPQPPKQSMDQRLERTKTFGVNASSAMPKLSFFGALTL